MLYVSNSTHNRLSFNPVLGEQGSRVSLFFLSKGNLLRVSSSSAKYKFTVVDADI